MKDRDANPLLWDSPARSWHAQCEMGYAIQEEDGQLVFKTKSQLNPEETLDRT